MLKSNNKTEKISTNLITNSLVDLGEDIAVEGKGKGRKFISRFIEPGVAHYEEFGDVLITKETLNKFIHTMIGCPVIIKHKDIDDKNADKERVGVISNVWFNEADGWYYCDGIIWDKQAIDLVKNQGWNVSCTYDFESDKQPKTHNGKKLDMEFTNGEFLHLALVDNPRYERANIVMNSKAENADQWITIKPNGEEHTGRHLLIKEGETVGEALYRTYGDSKQQKLFDTSEYKQSKEEIKKNREEQKQAEKKHEKIKDIEDLLKKSEVPYSNIDKNTKEILAQDLKKLKEEGIKDKQEQPKEEKKKFNKEFEDLFLETQKLELEYLKNPNPEIAKKYNENRNKLMQNKEFAELLIKSNIPRLEKRQYDKAKQPKEEKKAKNSLTSIFAEAIAEVVTNCLGECRNNEKEKGIWKTIKGTHIFIKDGESIEQAFKRATGKNLSDKTQEKDTDKQKESQNDVLNLSKQYVESLTKPQKEALTIYTDDERYTKINAYLRGERGNIDTKTDKTIKELDKAFKNAELSSDITVYRGVRADFIEKALEDTKFKDRFEQTFFKTPKEFELDNIKNHFVGKEFAEKGFMSSSYDKNKAFQNVEIMLTVNLKKGAKALNVSSLSAHDEAEILINRGYNFRISDVQIDKNPYGKARWNFMLDMIPLS